MKSTRSTALFLLILLSIAALAGSSLVRAQSPIQTQQPPRPDPTSSPAKVDGRAASNGSQGADAISLGSDTDYRISANDVIDIRIEKAEELSGTYRIGASGGFEMPFLGRVVGKGKTSDELAKFIADGLKNGYLVNPQVKVVITQYSGRSFFIQGAVRSPGLYQIGGYPTLLELITIAGGLADNHGSSAFIIRKTKLTETTPSEAAEPGTSAAEPAIQKYDLVKVNINGLLRGMFDKNIGIEPGDIINIPISDVFFISGEVHAPGSFPLKDGTTLSQAISLAQGTTFKAALNRGIIFREDLATGTRLEVKVDVGAVMGGKNQDIPILANDVIIIPNSKMKSVGSAILSGFGYSFSRIVPIRP